jgi:hypothetical protein
MFIILICYYCAVLLFYYLLLQYISYMRNLGKFICRRISKNINKFISHLIIADGSEWSHGKLGYITPYVHIYPHNPNLLRIYKKNKSELNINLRGRNVGAYIEVCLYDNSFGYTTPYRIYFEYIKKVSRFHVNMSYMNHIQYNKLSEIAHILMISGDIVKLRKLISV